MGECRNFILKRSQTLKKLCPTKRYSSSCYFYYYNKHLKFYIYDESYRKIQSIFFRALDNKAGIFLYENIESTYHFAGNIEINDWLGKKIPNFVVKDIALANS